MRYFMDDFINDFIIFHRSHSFREFHKLSHKWFHTWFHKCHSFHKVHRFPLPPFSFFSSSFQLLAVCIVCLRISHLVVVAFFVTAFSCFFVLLLVWRYSFFVRGFATSQFSIFLIVVSPFYMRLIFILFLSFFAYTFCSAFSWGMWPVFMGWGVVGFCPNCSVSFPSFICISFFPWISLSQSSSFPPPLPCPHLSLPLSSLSLISSFPTDDGLQSRLKYLDILLI